MVYIKSWNEYQTKAEQLYTEHPTRTRYCVKYRAAQGTLVLKVTDDNTCLKFKTKSSIILNRFEALNLSLMAKMQNRRKTPPPIPMPSLPSTSAAGGSVGVGVGVAASAGGTPRAGTPAQAHMDVDSPAPAKKKPKKKKK